MNAAVERSAIRKICWRLLPLMVLTYLLAYIDRINVGFAALTMQDDLHMSATEFGFASGVFFWGYFFFEIPSSAILAKIGARTRIARIMIIWGLLAGATAFVTGVLSFAAVRFLLGLAEAGFFPAVILYFAHWFPHYHHGRIMSGFLVGLPVAAAIGSPVSTALLSLDGLLGLRGWQCMYILEAIPTVLSGIVVLFVLTDKPEQAKFLTAEERTWLAGRLAAERTAKESVLLLSVWKSFYNAKVLLLSANYFGIVTASLGMLIFIPQIIKSLGVTSNMTVGWLTMIPYVCGTVSLLVWGAVSDRLQERHWNLFLACVLSTAGLAIAGLTMGTWWALFGMTIAACGFYGTMGPFWATPPMFLTAPAAAAAMAWIGSLGNLGGFFGPGYVGLIKDATGSYAGGLYGLAALGFITAAVCAFFVKVPSNAEPVGSQASARVSLQSRAHT
ncbi:MAG: MFS transporter [Rhodopila sp.]|nr:MFS transporter [Rhodopila sp.]